MSLPYPGIDLLKEIDTIFFNYIWNSRVDRIARKGVVKQYSDGGLKMINTMYQYIYQEFKDNLGQKTTTVKLVVGNALMELITLLVHFIPLPW